MELTNKISEALEMVSDDAAGYYNTETEEIFWIFDFDDDSKELAEDIEENYEKYILLPTRYEINEYAMMKEFAINRDDPEISRMLRNCLCGKRVFRRFKDKIYYLGIEKEWFEYRDSEYRKIAKKWVADNKDRIFGSRH